MGGGQRSPTPDSTYRRTGSEPQTVRPATASEPASESRPPSSTTSNRSTSSSPAPSTPAESLLPSNISLGGLSVDDDDEDDDPVAHGSAPPLDDALVLALGLPKDRLLLLRAELEMERFVADAAYVPPSRPPYCRTAC